MEEFKLKNYKVTVNGQEYDVAVEEAPKQGASTPAANAVNAVVNQPASAPASANEAPSAGAGEEVLAPMPGTILDIKVSNGEEVKSGQVLFVLEAMKMENDIVAPTDGKVSSLLVKKGDSVNSNDVLATVE